MDNILTLCIWARISDQIMWLKDYIYEHKGVQKNSDGHMVIPK